MLNVRHDAERRSKHETPPLSTLYYIWFFEEIVHFLGRLRYWEDDI